MGKIEVHQDWIKRAYSFRIRIVEAFLGDSFGTDILLSEEHEAFASQQLSLEGIVENFRAPEGTQMSTPNLVEGRLSIKINIGDLIRGPDGLLHYGCLGFREHGAGTETDSYLNISEEQFQKLCRKLPLYFLAFGQNAFVWTLEASALTREPCPELNIEGRREWKFWCKNVGFYLSNRERERL